MKKIAALVLALVMILSLGCAAFAEDTAVDGFSKDTAEAYLGEMVYVEGGSFEMGREGGHGDAEPIHTVEVESFYMQPIMVTEQLYAYVNGLDETDSLIPQQSISWYQAIAFCNKLSLLFGYEPCYYVNGESDPELWGEIPSDKDTMWDAAQCNFSADGFRLPREAEWEYAAKGGVNHDPYEYAGSDDPDEVAWTELNTNYEAHEVALLAPNSLGLYDMSGNVREWCFESDYLYLQDIVVGTDKATRGGSADKDRLMYCPVNARGFMPAWISGGFMGMRLVRSASEVGQAEFIPTAFEAQTDDIEQLVIPDADMTGKSVVIALSDYDLSDDTQAKLYESLQAAVSELFGDEAGILVRDAGRDSEAQNTGVNELLDLGVSYMVIIPNGPKSQIPALFSCSDAAVPIINVARRAVNIGRAPLTTYIGLDEFAAAKEAMEYTAAALGYEGNIVYLHSTLEDPEIGVYRHEGADTVIAEHGETMKVVAEETIDGNERNGARFKIRTMLESGLEISAVFCESDELALGAYEAISEYEGSQILVSGFGSSREALANISDDGLICLIYEDAKDEAYTIARVIYQLTQNEAVEPSYVTSHHLITAENVSAFFAD